MTKTIQEAMCVLCGCTDTDSGEPPTSKVRPAGPRQFIFSKLTKCPKCGEMARLRRLADADMGKDAWIHPGPNCTVKIAHYQIKDDAKYVGGEVATPPSRPSIA